MTPKQEPKYEAVAFHAPSGDLLTGRLINRATGEAIPDDEPVFVFRARDKHAASALIFYRDQCKNEHHKAVIQSRWEDFMRFWREHPERMKEPDTEKQT